MALDLVHDALAVLPHISHMRRASLTQATPCLPIGPITGNTPLTALAPKYYNSGKGGPPVPRPFMGGVQSGFHAMPALGDDFLTLYEPKFKPAGSISVAFDPTKLDVLVPGESFQRHADGRIADYLKADGSTTLYSDTSPAISILASIGGTLSLSAPTLALTGITGITGALTVSGLATFNGGVGIPGNMTVGGTLGVTGLTTLGAVTIGSTTNVAGALNANGGLTVSSMTVAGTTFLNGTVSGATCTITLPHALSLFINGAFHTVPLLS